MTIKITLMSIMITRTVLTMMSKKIKLFTITTISYPKKIAVQIVVRIVKIILAVILMMRMTVI